MVPKVLRVARLAENRTSSPLVERRTRRKLSRLWPTLRNRCLLVRKRNPESQPVFMERASKHHIPGPARRNRLFVLHGTTGPSNHPRTSRSGRLHFPPAIPRPFPRVRQRSSTSRRRELWRSFCPPHRDSYPRSEPQDGLCSSSRSDLPRHQDSDARERVDGTPQSTGLHGRLRMRRRSVPTFQT